MGAFTGDKASVLFQSLSGFWQRFFRDTEDLEAFYQASETYLGQVYLDLMSSVLGTCLTDTPLFNREQWKLFLIDETQINYIQGLTAADDRYVFDPEGPIVNLQILQNTIFDPQVVYDRDVDYFVENNDGLVRFKEDPFRRASAPDGSYQPQPGVAWRKVSKAVGNRFVDSRAKSAQTYWDWYDAGVRKGDTLRYVAKSGAQLTTGATGSLLETFSGDPDKPDFNLYDSAADFVTARCVVGDIVQVVSVTASADVEFVGYYVVKTVTSATQLLLDGSAVPVTVPHGSSGSVTWRVYTGIYLDEFLDCEIEYQSGKYLVGPSENPYPYDGTNCVWVYSIIRDDPAPTVAGFPLSGFAPESTPLSPLQSFQLADRHIVEGTVVVRAKVTQGGARVPVEEGRDYSVDYLNGYIHQLTHWYDDSIGRCSYTHKREVLYCTGGLVEPLTQGEVMQLSLWAPEVQVDRFTLYYNYGSLINRFAASSETYRAYIRGIFALYINGPVFKRMESALNVAATYPVTQNSQELLLSYDNGVTATGTAAQLVALEDKVIISTGEYVLTEADEGGYITFSGASSEANNGSYLITAVNTDTNTATLATTYGFVDESGIDWVFSRTNTQVVTTNARTYTFPFGTPMKDFVTDPTQYNTLILDAFEPLTSVFRVVDYIEDPSWWHGMVIPPELWGDSSLTRRTALTRLVEHVFDPEDTACFDDPGLYFDAGDLGVTPDGSSIPVYRHSAAYILFDKYLKMHTFHVSISTDVTLLPAFKADLEEIILISKPSYTYPFVGVKDIYVDTLYITDEMTIANVTFNFGKASDGYSDTIRAADNALIFDDVFPTYFGDYFRYDTPQTLVISAGTSVVAGTTFDLTPDTDAGITAVDVPATRSGIRVAEGLDYTVQWLADSTHPWRITVLRDWDALAAPLTITFWQTLRVNDSDPDYYGYDDGWNPIIVDGGNPWYVRATALDPTSVAYTDELQDVRREHIDRPVYIVTTDPGTIAYIENDSTATDVIENDATSSDELEDF